MGETLREHMKYVSSIVSKWPAWKRDLLGNKISNSTKKSNWEILKSQGSNHYKTGDVEPIDLYLSGGMFRSFALCSIIKYAFRNRNVDEPLRISDLDKIIDYAQKLKATAQE